MGELQRMNIAMIGYKFMGKAHSHAYKNVGFFFDVPVKPVRQLLCGRHEVPLRTAAERWHWKETSIDWREAVTRADIDIVDIAAPQSLHCDMAVAAAQAGKHILLEKPMAMNAAEALKMLTAVEQAGVKHMMVFNYRRCPAVRLARQLIDEGRIGRIFHWRGVYLQDRHIDPLYPLKWKHRREMAGSGAHGDLNAHLIDLARYLVGEIAAVQGMSQTFITRRPFPEDRTSLESVPQDADGMGEVTVDDTTSFLAEFDNGARGTFEASRFASGRKNFNRFEINGSKGSLCFNFERMNELEFYDCEDPFQTRGFRTISATEATHPYMKHWWPVGHVIGYEHTFIHQIADFLQCMHDDTVPEPNFHDGWRCQQVLDAVLESAANGRRVTVPVSQIK